MPEHPFIILFGMLCGSHAYPTFRLFTRQTISPEETRMSGIEIKIAHLYEWEVGRLPQTGLEKTDSKRRSIKASTLLVAINHTARFVNRSNTTMSILTLVMYFQGVFELCPSFTSSGWRKWRFVLKCRILPPIVGDMPRHGKGEMGKCGEKRKGRARNKEGKHKKERKEKKWSGEMKYIYTCTHTRAHTLHIHPNIRKICT